MDGESSVVDEGDNMMMIEGMAKQLNSYGFLHEIKNLINQKNNKK